MSAAKRFIPIALISLTSAFAQGVFDPVMTSYHAFTNQTGVLVEDLNGDGRPDIAVYSSTNGIAVLLGKGDGSFKAPLLNANSDSTGHSASILSLAAGDVNGDKTIDLLALNNDLTISLFPGNGDGTFEAPIMSSPAPPAPDIYLGPGGVTLGDLNHDGKPDLITAGARVFLGSGNGTFQLLKDYGGGHAGIALEDFNRDGKPDIALLYPGALTLNILLGKGDGTFQTPITYPGGGYGCKGITTADFNGDGKPDIATTCVGEGALRVYLGNGDGTFGTPLRIAPGWLPDSVVSRDFDGDGQTDLAVSDHSCSCVRVLPGNGDGTFQPIQTYAITKLFAIASGDFNGDGRPDLVATNTITDSINILLSKTPISLTLQSSANPSTYGQDITLTATIAATSATGVITFKDGATSLGVSTVTHGVATLSLSKLTIGVHNMTAVYGGDTVFPASTGKLTQNVAGIPTQTTLIFSASETGSAILTASVSPVTATGAVTFRDGATILGTASLKQGIAILTVASLGGGVHSMTASYGGDAAFAPSASISVSRPSPGISLTSSPNPSGYGRNIVLTATMSAVDPGGTVTFQEGAVSLGSAALSGGHAALELSTLSLGVHSLTAVYSGDGKYAGTASPPISQSVVVTVTLTSVANPVNYGAPVELKATVSPASATGKMTFYDGLNPIGIRTVTEGEATFSTRMLPSGPRALRAYYSGDAVVPAASSDTIFQTVNALPASGFRAPVYYKSGNDLAADAAVGNFNGDGNVDFAMANESKDVSIILGNGDGTFRAPVSYSVDALPRRIVAADLNGDSNTDLIVELILLPGEHLSRIAILLGNGDGSFQAETTVIVSGISTGLAAGDFNLDGKTDIAVSGLGFLPYPDLINILLGNGDGTFQTVAPVAAGFTDFLATGDFDNDGKADLAVVHTTRASKEGALTVYRGNGDGSFETPSASGATGLLPDFLAIGDFNGDGNQDVAVSNEQGDGEPSHLNVFPGGGDGSFQSSSSIGVGANPATISAVDVNGDGNLDLIFDDGGFPFHTGQSAGAPSGLFKLLIGNGDGTFQPAIIYFPAESNGLSYFLIAADFNGDGIVDIGAGSTKNDDGNISHWLAIMLGIPSNPPPQIRASNGVVNAAGPLGGAAPGAWMTLYGSYLSKTTRVWGVDDFAGNNLPASLDGVSVTVNGKPAYVDYVSPTQVNFLTPKDQATGPVSVQLINANGASNTMTVDLQPAAPAVFSYSAQQGKYAVAEDGFTYALLGPVNLLGSSVPVQPATPGEVILLYATGLGETNPPYPGGQIIQTAAEVATPPQVLIGDVSATVQYAGLIGAGLYQLNVVVPALPSGDATLVINANGMLSQDKVFLNIH